MSQPVLTIVAGCNGAGKSTYSKKLVGDPIIPFDYDKRQKEVYDTLIDSDIREVMAKNMTTNEFESSITRAFSLGEDFCYETNFDSSPLHGMSTFFKYADLAGYRKPTKVKTERQAKGFRATRPFEWLHVDVTNVQTQNDGVQYVAFIKDNYSKALLGYKSVSYKPDSNFIRDLFEETFIKYHLLNASDQINILSDGGSENKGSLIEWINQISAPPVVLKLTAKTDAFPFSNSMSESTHSIYKSEFLKKKHSVDINQHFEHLDRFMIYYNHKRYPFEHFGLTPNEVLEGEKPNKYRFREQIQNRKKERLEENRTFNGCPLVCS